MILLLAAAALISGAVFFTLGVRPKDLPPPPEVSPVEHLEQRKAQIYENLRDLQFEYRVGKLSDEDYLKSKTELQTELAKVMSEMDGILKKAPPAPPKEQATKEKPANVCPHCGASF